MPVLQALLDVGLVSGELWSPEQLPSLDHSCRQTGGDKGIVTSQRPEASQCLITKAFVKSYGEVQKRGLRLKSTFNVSCQQIKKKLLGFTVNSKGANIADK